MGGKVVDRVHLVLCAGGIAHPHEHRVHHCRAGHRDGDARLCRRLGGQRLDRPLARTRRVSAGVLRHHPPTQHRDRPIAEQVVLRTQFGETVARCRNEWGAVHRGQVGRAVDRVGTAIRAGEQHRRTGEPFALDAPADAHDGCTCARWRAVAVEHTPAQRHVPRGDRHLVELRRLARAVAERAVVELQRDADHEPLVGVGATRGHATGDGDRHLHVAPVVEGERRVRAVPQHPIAHRHPGCRQLQVDVGPPAGAAVVGHVLGHVAGGDTEPA